MSSAVVAGRLAVECTAGSCSSGGDRRCRRPAGSPPGRARRRRACPAWTPAGSPRGRLRASGGTAARVGVGLGRGPGCGGEVAVEGDRRLGVHPGGVEGCGECGIADVVGQGGGDLVGRLDRHRVLRGLLVQHPLADRVERAGDTGAHLSRAQRPTRLARCLGYGGTGDARPPTGQCGVEDPGEVDHVGLALVELAVQRVLGAGDLEAGVDDVPDQLDGARVRDQHRLGVQPAVGDALGVPGGDRLGHLTGQPGGARGRQGAPLEHQVQRDAVAPLVHDPGDAVARRRSRAPAAGAGR